MLSLKPGEELQYRETTVEFYDAFRSAKRVQGYTHDFYKYPARFSPAFARYFIENVTEPGDYVLDPFMGGGTTIVEATVSGRQAIGSDLNELSHFVTKVKTTPLSRQDIYEVRGWVGDVRASVAEVESGIQSNVVAARNMPASTYPFFAIAKTLAERLQFPRRRRFAKCALLRVGQWAMDATSTIPESNALCDELERRVERMISGLREFVTAAMAKGVYKNKITSTHRLMSRSASAPVLARTLLRRGIRPKLILTSPPYPGVHVLYHRWQVLGRRETPAPYWIAGIQDGHGESFYTMGSRSELGLRNYFRGLSAAFKNLRKIVGTDSTVVQLMSFSDATVQLPLYLDAMTGAGFKESSIGAIDSRQIRLVPNRKWYNQGRTSNDAGREVLLIHRPLECS